VQTIKYQVTKVQQFVALVSEPIDKILVFVEIFHL